MLVPVGWLLEYLSEPLSSLQVAEAMEKAGIEVEAIHRPADFDQLIQVGKVLETKPHPKADKLKVAIVDTSQGKKSIVCGAPNVDAGQTVAVALTGAFLPDATEIKAAEIRQIKSEGMLCSPRELGLSNDHSGILVLDDSLAVGQALKEIYSSEEAVIDVATAANRPDLQSLVGIAREVSVHTGLELQNVEQTTQLAGENAKGSSFINQATEVVPRYSLAQLKLPDKLSETPPEIKQRLTQAGVRPISLVVDITNYVMLEYGQPLHAFDAEKIEGKVAIRFAKADELVTTLDAEKRHLSAEDIVIADNKKVIGIGGVMGAANSEVSEKTRVILLEAANFNGASIRRTARRHGLRTEASSRFEHNLPLQTVAIGMNRCIDLLTRTAGASVVEVEDEMTGWPWLQHVGVRHQRISQLAGVEITQSQVISILTKLGFKAEPFDIAAEAKKHLGKPYKWGANYKQDKDRAFDCSYLVDYIYSLIGLSVGHTSAEQAEHGVEVGPAEIRVGDVVYRDGPWEQLGKAERKGVSHTYIYIGDGKVIHAKDRQRDKTGSWTKVAKSMVVEEELEPILADPDYLGIRRMLPDLKGWIAVDAPWWRPDIKREEDILEEVIKVVGLEEVPATLPAWQPNHIKIDKSQSRWWEVRGLLRALGGYEVTTYPFISEAEIKLFGLDPANHLKLKNPHSQEQSHLRRDMLPNLARALSNNTNRAESFWLFEMAKVFTPNNGEELPTEQSKLALVVQAPAAYPRAKFLLDQILGLAGIKATLEITDDLNFLHPARQARVTAPAALGWIGQLHPDIGSRLKIRGQAACLELDWQALLEAWQQPIARPLSRFPSIFRDITIVVDNQATWQDIAAAVSKQVGVALAYGGDYVSAQLPAGRRAVTLHLELSSLERTLTDSEAEAKIAQILEMLGKRFNAQLQAK